MRNVIQGGYAPILTSTDRPLTIRYENAIMLVIQSKDHGSLMAFSEGNLDSPYARFKVRKGGDAAGEGPYALILPFSQPTSGTLFFRSQEVADESFVEVVQMGGIN